MRLIAVGDIHGEFDHLERLMVKLTPKEDDKIIFLGDYIDRGPKNPETVSFLLEFAKQFPNTVFLRGNHEQMMLDSESRVSRNNSEDFMYHYLWVDNGGAATINQYEKTNGLFEEHRPFFLSTKLRHKEEFEGETYYFSHAGWDCFRGLETQYQKPNADYLLWEREHMSALGRKLAEDNWTEGVAVFGHSPRKEPLNLPFMIGIDTGAVFGNYLTAVVLGKERVFYTSE